MKATHGLASPQEFTLPAPHAMWGGDTYAGFDVSKAHPPQPVGLLSRGDGWVGGGELSLYGEALPQRGTFFRRQVYERVGTSILEVYEMEWKSVISVCKKDQKG